MACKIFEFQKCQTSVFYFFNLNYKKIFNKFIFL
jgi:hypothetical protein